MDDILWCYHWNENFLCRTFAWCFLFLKILLKGIWILVFLFLGYNNISKKEVLRRHWTTTIPQCSLATSDGFFNTSKKLSVKHYYLSVCRANSHLVLDRINSQRYEGMSWKTFRRVNLKAWYMYMYYKKRDYNRLQQAMCTRHNQNCIQVYPQVQRLLI